MHDDDTYDGCCGDDGPYYFDEQGDLVDADQLAGSDLFFPRIPVPVIPREPIEVGPV